MAYKQIKSIIGLMMFVCIVVAFILGMAEAAKIETFNSASCAGSPTNTFYVGGNTCQKFNDQGAVRISDVSSSTRVSVHNQQACEANSQVAQIYGDGCVVKGNTALRAVWIQG